MNRAARQVFKLTHAQHWRRCCWRTPEGDGFGTARLTLKMPATQTARMKAEEIRRIAESRRGSHSAMWKVVGKFGLAVVGLVGTFAFKLPQAPAALYPTRDNLPTYLMLLALASLAYLYLVRPHLKSFLSQDSSVARSPKDWQYAVLTTALDKHGLTGAFVGVVGANVLAYSLLAAAAWQIRGEATGPTLWFVTTAMILAGVWAAMYGLARLVPRKSFANSHAFIRWIELGIVSKVRGQETDIPIGKLSKEQFNVFVRIAFIQKRLSQAAFLGACVWLASLIYTSLPDAIFTPTGVIGSGLVILVVVSLMATWTTLATVIADNSHNLLGQLEYAVREGEIAELEGTRTFLVIEILRANHIRPAGGFNQVFALGAETPSIEEINARARSWPRPTSGEPDASDG